MRPLAYILRFSNWLTAVLGGTVAFFWFANIINLDNVAIFARQINNHPGGRIILMILAVYLVLFNLLYFVGSFFTRQYATHIKLPISGGDVSVALSAIEHSLRRMVRKLPDIHDIHIRIYKDKKSEEKPTIIQANYSTWEETNVQEVTEKIQQIMRMRFQEIVPTKEPPVFRITLSNIIDRESKKSESRKKEKTPAAEHQMFYGPEYPVDKK